MQSGDGHVQGDEGDARALCFLAGGLPGAGVVMCVSRGGVAVGPAEILLPELGRPHLVLQHPGRGRGGQRPVLQRDALRPGGRCCQPGEYVGVHVLAGRFPPRPGHRHPTAVPVAVPQFLGTARPGIGPVQMVAVAEVATGGEQPVDVTADGRVEGGAADSGDVGGPGPAAHGDAAAAELRFESLQRAADFGDGFQQGLRCRG